VAIDINIFLPVADLPLRALIFEKVFGGNQEAGLSWISYLVLL
jgi:hypothetical protein